MAFLKSLFSKKVMSLSLLGALLVLFVPDLALAQTNTTQDSFQDSLRALAGFLAVIVRALTFICLFIMDKGMVLMGTDIVIGEKAMSGILPIWIFVRNVTNIGFVAIILFIAVYNLVKNGQGDWSIKEKLPKVILALIAINFSLTGMKVMIEGVNVATIGVLSISDVAIEGKGITDLNEALDKPISLKNPELSYKCETNDPPEDCKPFREAINASACKNAKSGVPAKETDGCFFLIADELTVTTPPNTDPSAPKTDANASNFNHNIFLAFGIHFLQLENLPLLAADIPDFFAVIDSVLFSAIMAIMYSVVFIALFIVLIVRVVILWALMMASPILIAAAILGIGEAGEGSKKFFTYLLIPLKIGAVFALTFVMSSVMIDYQIPNDKTSNFIEVGSALSQFWGLGGFGIIWKVMILVVFWKAAFWAIKDTEAQFIVDKVQQGAQTVGKFGATWAASEIRVPSVEGKESGMSLLGLSKGIPAIANQTGALNTDAVAKMRNAMNLGSEAADEADNLSKSLAALSSGVNKFDIVDELTKSGGDAIREFARRADGNRELTKRGFTPDQIKRLQSEEIDIQRKVLADFAYGGDIDRISLTEKGSATGTRRDESSANEKHKITVPDGEGKNTTINYDQKAFYSMGDLTARNTAAEIEPLLTASGITRTELSAIENLGPVAQQIIDATAGLDIDDKEQIVEALSTIRGEYVPPVGPTTPPTE